MQREKPGRPAPAACRGLLRFASSGLLALALGIAAIGCTASADTCAAPAKLDAEGKCVFTPSAEGCAAAGLPFDPASKTCVGCPVQAPFDPKTQTCVNNAAVGDASQGGDASSDGGVQGADTGTPDASDSGVDAGTVADGDTANEGDTATDVAPDGQGPDAPASDATATADAEVCVPDCKAKVCGPDGCGGTCGECSTETGIPYCSNGTCQSACAPACVDSHCGPDGCGGVCGVCKAGWLCVMHQCVAPPPTSSCQGICGKMAPGGCSCTAGCKVGECCLDYQALCACVKTCAPGTCGADGCGGTCGPCAKGTLCQQAKCVDDACDPDPCNGKGACQAGTCTCAAEYAGKACDTCAVGYGGWPDCKPDPCFGQTCTGNGTCDAKSGACACKAGFAGAVCGKCQFPLHPFPQCGANACDGVTCSGQGTCQPENGQCYCKAGFFGLTCGSCLDPTQTWPGCTPPNNAGYKADAAITSVGCDFCGPSLDKAQSTADLGDSQAPSLKVVMPPAGAKVVAGTPIVLVIDDVIDPKSVTAQTFKLTPKGSAEQVTGSIVLQTTATKQTVLIFFPSNVSASGEFTLEVKGIQDKGGNALPAHAQGLTLDGVGVTGDFANNLGFESGSAGCSLAGDASSVVASDNMAPVEGKRMLVLTTHNKATVGTSAALDGRASIAVCGPMLMPAGKSKLLFDYNFASAEFDESVGQAYDDLAIAAFSGPKGGVGGVFTSVNIVGKTGKETKAFGLPDTGDEVAKMSGWQTANVTSPQALGGWVVLTFVVSDVADAAFTSLVTIDNVRFE